MTGEILMNRRDAIATGAAALSLSAVSSEAADGKTPWIDAHSHIWSPDTKKFPLQPGLTKDDLKPPSFTDEELMAVARPVGVGRVVLIQHSIFHGFDNKTLIDAWQRHPDRFRVVAMVDDRKPKPGERMKKLLKSGVTGFRITPFIRKDQQSDAWLDNPGMHEMWKTAASTRQAMCCLINPEHLPQVAKMCRAHPETHVVIDHFSRIGEDGQIREKDVTALAGLARFKKMNVKVSAFYALGKKQPPYDDLVPMIRRLYDSYGPKRLMWASDSPYQINEKNSYADSIALIRDRIDFLSRSDRQDLLQGTAKRVYFW